MSGEQKNKTNKNQNQTRQKNKTKQKKKKKKKMTTVVLSGSTPHCNVFFEKQKSLISTTDFTYIFNVK